MVIALINQDDLKKLSMMRGGKERNENYFAILVLHLFISNVTLSASNQIIGPLLTQKFLRQNI